MPEQVEIDVLFPDPIISDVVIDRMGPSGIGVPIGGTTGQHLAKKSNTDYDFNWVAADQDPDWANVQSKPGYATHSADATHDGYLLQGDWTTFNGKQAALGFTPENVTNKDTDGTLAANSDTKYASQKATKTYVDNKISTDGANPTTTVSGSVVNGSASTFMRSDAAPALANTTVTAGSYGDASHVPGYTVDAQGRLTAASSTAIVITPTAAGLSNVTNDVQTKAAIVPNTVPTAGQILAGNAGGTAYAPVSLSGSGATATLSSAGVLTLSAIANGTLSNSAITIAGTSTFLGGSITLNTILGFSVGQLSTWSGITPGTGVATALAVNVGTAGAPVINGGVLGTPSSGVATNLTGTASGLTAGNVTTNANLTGAVTSSGNATSLGSFSSANLATALTDETGTGIAVFGTNPTLTGATIDSGSLILQGNQSAAAWTTSGIRLKGISGTLTDTTSSGTVAAAYTNKLGGNTIAASSATTFTNYISGYFSEPVAGTNVTLTNKWALGADSLYVGTSNPLKVTSAGVLTAISPVLTTPDLGTPSALVGTNITGTATAFNINGTVGATTPAAGTFTTLTGNASGLTINAGGTNQNITLTPGGTGQVIIPTGSAAKPSIAFASHTTQGFYDASSEIRLAISAADRFGWGTQNASNFSLLSDGSVTFSSSASNVGAVPDTWISRKSAGITRFGTSSANSLGSWEATNGTLTGTLAVTGASTLTGAVTQTAKTTTYNNIATVSNGVPSEVATIDSTGLTANVAASTLYAIPASGAGLYRVSAYLVTTTAASISSTMPNAQVVYTDSDSNTSVTLDVSPILGAAGLGQSGLLTANAVGTVFSGTVVVYIKASTTIQYQTVNYASTAGGMAYALRMKLEAL